MTARQLQQDLIADLAEVFKGKLYRAPSGTDEPVTIAEQNLPKRESEDDDDPFPYIIVRLSEGQIASQTDAHDVDTILLLGAYDDSPKNNGHRIILEMVEKIQQHYEENQILTGRFVLKDPVAWALQDEESWPYFFGAMNLTWQATAPRQKGSRFT